MRKLLPCVVVAGAVLAGAVLAGCGGGRTTEYGVIVEEESIGGIAGEASATGLGSDDGFEQSGDLLTRRVVYFEYDSSILTAEGEAVVQAHARYLQGVSNARVILEGHADERGTREYNLALAEDRAKSAANVMQALGVDASRIQTVSYGEERPVALGHDEPAWNLNRRVEILYQ